MKIDLSVIDLELIIDALEGRLGDINIVAGKLDDVDDDIAEEQKSYEDLITKLDCAYSVRTLYVQCNSVQLQLQALEVKQAIESLLGPQAQ